MGAACGGRRARDTGRNDDRGRSDGGPTYAAFSYTTTVYQIGDQLAQIVAAADASPTRSRAARRRACAPAASHVCSAIVPTPTTRSTKSPVRRRPARGDGAGE